MSAKTLIATAGLALLSASPGWAAFDKGGVLGVGARPVGMGDAFTAIADDSNAPHWNPAGLIQIPRMEVSAFFGPLLNGKEYYMNGTFAMPFLEQTAMALSMVTLFHDTGNPDTQAFENTFLFTFATPLNVEKSVGFGINLKFLQYASNASAPIAGGQRIYAQAGALGLDLGFLYGVPLPQYGKKVAFGFRAEDLDTVLRWQSGVEERVPLRIQFGAAYWLEENLSASVDFSFFNDTNISGRPLDTPLYTTPGPGGTVITTLEPEQHRPHVGLEGWFFNGHLGLRTGYTGFATTADRFTGGVSYKQPTYGVDYAYMGHAEHLGDSHRLSGHFSFGAGGERPRVVALVNPPTMPGARPSNNAVHLQWEPNPDPHVTGYSIYMSKAPGTGYIPIQKRIKDNKVIIDGLTNGTRYYFVVTAVNNSWPAVESNYSTEVSAVPSPQLVSAPTLGGAAETQPQGPIANCVYVARGWSYPLTSGYAGYNLYMSSTSGQGYKKVNTEGPINAPTYKLSNLECNKRYFFVITNLSADTPPVESKPSQEFSASSVADTAPATGQPQVP